MPIAPITINNSLNIDRWKNFISPQQHNAEKIDFLHEFPWVKDKSIANALTELKKLKFAPEDIMYLKSFGVNIPFKSGAEAVDFIEKQNIRIIFEPTSENGVHAQYDFYKNLIVINKNYKDSDDFALTLAISEAILHETGHAKDKDGYSSIQEELNFLGMNAIAHRAYMKKYGNLFTDSNAPIINDGVSVYAKLFFDPDPEKKALIKRIAEKYGDLPSGDSKHPPGIISRNIKNYASTHRYCYVM